MRDLSYHFSSTIICSLLFFVFNLMLVGIAFLFFPISWEIAVLPIPLTVIYGSGFYLGWEYGKYLGHLDDPKYDPT